MQELVLLQQPRLARLSADWNLAVDLERSELPRRLDRCHGQVPRAVVRHNHRPGELRWTEKLSLCVPT